MRWSNTGVTDMAQHARFHLVHDGPALVQHQMDVRALAAALLAMGDLVERANELLNGSQATVSVNVHASFKSGSFGIDLKLAQSLWQRALDFANSNPATGILSIAGPARYRQVRLHRSEFCSYCRTTGSSRIGGCHC